MTSAEKLQNLHNELIELKSSEQKQKPKGRIVNYYNHQEYLELLRKITDIVDQARRILEDNPHDFNADIPVLSSMIGNVCSGNEWVITTLLGSLKDVEENG